MSNMQKDYGRKLTPPVTKEEAAWESFSEDEPAPPSKKAKVSAPPPAAKAGAKKGGKGQGNIMSFFAKK